MTGSRSRVAAFGVGLTLCGSLLLTGCTASGTEQLTAAPTAPATADPSPAVASTPAPSSTPAPTPTPTPAPEPTPAPVVTITLDGFVYDAGGATETVSLDSSPELIEYLESLTGSTPSVSEIEDPWGNGTVVGTSYRWDEVRANDYGGMASVAVLASAIDSTRLQTAEGIAVGSTRAEAIAAGAWESSDEDGDGVTDHLGIGSRDVPGTESLQKPGSVGVEFLLLVLEGDLVTQIQFPGNDFGDI